MRKLKKVAFSHFFDTLKGRPPLFCCPAILPYVLLHAFRGDVQLPGVLEIPAQQLEGGGVVKAVAYALVGGKGVGEIPAEELPEPNTDREYELPEASAISRDQRERVKRAIDALPDIYRETVMLHYYSGLDYKTIAAMQGSTEGTVKSRIFRAKERLYELLKEGEKND